MAPEPVFSLPYLCMAQSQSQNPGEQENMAAGWVWLANSSLLQLRNTGCSAWSSLPPLQKKLSFSWACAEEMWVSRSPPSHVSLLALRTAVWVGGWGLSSNLISRVVPLHLTLHLCAELLSNTVPLCLLLHCLSSGCFPWIEF